MKFIETHFIKIVLIFLLINFLQQCNNSHKLSSLEKQAKTASARLDSISTSSELERALQIEGLKAEMRMIQSTDRKILDVNRQSEIAVELKKLEQK
jgi:hypothetical protein